MPSKHEQRNCFPLEEREEGLMIIVMALVLLYVLLVIALPLWVSLLFVLLYALSYWDGKEYTGERHWPAFRRWSFWKRVAPRQYQLANPKDLAAVNYRSMRLYILVPGRTLSSLFWGIGLHGGTLSPFGERLHWVVPPLLLDVPLVRDVLMWAGAVTWHPKRLSLMDLLLQLLRSDRSVCFCPSFFPAEGALPLDEELFRFALEHQIELVPVVIHNESQRYRLLHAPRLQEWSRTHCRGYPWPQAAILQDRSTQLQVVFGPILHCTQRYASPAKLAEAFGAGLRSLSCADVGEEIFEIKIRSSNEEGSV